MKNYMCLRFEALSVNEGFARVVAGAFATQLDPTINELADIKTAVSEAVTNAIIHGYNGKGGQVTLEGTIEDQTLTLVIKDEGVGICDVEQARQPFYTTWQGDERSGMGFTVMETFMDSLEVESAPAQGVKVTMVKGIRGGER